MAEKLQSARIVNKTLFASLLKEAKQAGDQTSAINGAFGQRIQSAVENGNLDRKAFNIVKGLVRMKDETKRNACLVNLPLYIDMAVAAGHLPEPTPDLFDSRDDEQDENEFDSDPNGGDEAKRRATQDAADEAATKPKRTKSKKNGNGHADPALSINQGGEPDPAEVRRVTEEELAQAEAGRPAHAH